MTMGDVLLTPPLTSATLPSPSTLTGNYRPQTAAAFVEQTLADAKARASGKRLISSAMSAPTHLKGSMEEVSNLRSMASRHLGSLRQLPAAPYHSNQQQALPQRCISTPPLRPVPPPPPPPPPPQTWLHAQPHLHPHADTIAAAAAAGGGGSGGGSPVPSPRAGQLMSVHPSPSPGLATASQSVSIYPGPGSGLATASQSMSLHPGPGQGLATAAVGAGTGTVSNAVPEPLLLFAPTANVAVGLDLTHGTTPPNGGSAHPLFQHATLPRLVLPLDDVATTGPVSLGLSSGGGGGGAVLAAVAGSSSHGGGSAAASPHGPRTLPPQPLSPASSLPSPQLPLPQPLPQAASVPGPGVLPLAAHSRLGALPATPRPTTSMSVQDLSLPKPSSRLGSRSPSRGTPPQALDASRSGSWGGPKPSTPLQRYGSPAPLSSNHQYNHHPPLGGSAAGSAAAAATAASDASTGSKSPSCGSSRFHHTATRWAMESAGSGGAAANTGSPMNGPKVTRGMLYSIFQELDEYDSGRLTYSAFEQAACKIGMRPAQARRFFEHLDPQGKGYATMREWSSPALQRQMEAFTRLYVQATRDHDGRPKDITEVRSMHMAIQMAMVKLKLKRCGRAVSLDRLVQAFAYMDRDGNGTLNSEEVEDALNSLGIFVTKEVIDSIMRAFDKDSSGGVNYYEFVKSLYPTLDQAAYHH